MIASDPTSSFSTTLSAHGQQRYFGALLQRSRNAPSGEMTNSESNTPNQVEFAPELGALIEAIAIRRDRGAFATLFEYFAPRLKTMLLRNGVAKQRAEELAQDTLLVVWHKAHLFNPAGASASGWIYRIAKNLRIDSLRRERRAAQSTVDPSDQPDSTLQPDGILSEQETQKHVGLAVAQLSTEQQQVIRLSFFEDKPHSEIAAALNIPLGTVKSRLRLAMKRLRDLLDELS